MIVNFCPYWVYPPTGGGPIRVYNLNKNISEKALPILQLSLRPTYIMKNKYGLKNVIYSHRKVIISPNYVEYQLSNPITLLLSVISYKLLSNPDVLLRLLDKIRHKEILNSIHNDSEIFQIEHPWLFNLAEKYNKKGVPLFLSTHNCETMLIKTNNVVKKLIKFHKIEKNALENADVIFTVSKEDINAFKEVLNVDIEEKRVYLLPNGVDTKQIKPTDQKEREHAKSLLGFENKKVILFVGSIHKPNIEAVWEIIKIAKQFDGSYIFLVVGSVGEFFKKVVTPDNVVFTGFVEDISVYLKSADIALNPMLSGSGTNLKMLEYLALGLPIMSTPIGARGLEIINGKHAIITDISKFEYWIKELSNNPSLSLELSQNGRRLVEECYDWRIIAETAVKIYKKHGRS